MLKHNRRRRAPTHSNKPAEWLRWLKKLQWNNIYVGIFFFKSHGKINTCLCIAQQTTTNTSIIHKRISAGTAIWWSTCNIIFSLLTMILLSKYAFFSSCLLKILHLISWQKYGIYLLFCSQIHFTRGPWATSLTRGRFLHVYKLVIISPYRRVWLFIWKKKIEYTLPKDALCQVWLKPAL